VTTTVPIQLAALVAHAEVLFSHATVDALNCDGTGVLRRRTSGACSGMDDAGEPLS
jgi:hypothetical protein